VFDGETVRNCNQWQYAGANVKHFNWVLFSGSSPETEAHTRRGKQKNVKYSVHFGKACAFLDLIRDFWSDNANKSFYFSAFEKYHSNIAINALSLVFLVF
jgi:hypothetical protein